MSRTLIALGLLTMVGATSMSAALAAETIEPHQRIREMIVPPYIAHHPAPQETMGQPIETHGYVDPHMRARNAIRHEDWPPPSANQSAYVDRINSDYSDPHRHIRSMILGHDD